MKKLAGLFCFLMVSLFSVNANSMRFDIDDWKTTNGVRVLFVKNSQIPMLDIAVVFKGGAVYDGAQSGLAQLTNAMLNEGAGDYSVDQLAARFDRTGAKFDNGVGLETAVLTLRTLTEPKLLDTNIRTFNLILQKPTFPETSLQRLTQQMQVNLEMMNQDPGYVAMRAFTKAIYQTHPYANPVEGSTTSLQQLTVRDVKKFYRQFYVAKNVFIVMVGDISNVRAKTIAESLVGQLPKGASATAIASVPNNQPLTKTIDFSASQSTVIMGETGIQRSDPDYFPLLVGNYIFGGGGLSSILMANVREKEGLTYSISSSFSPLTQAGLFTISFKSRNAQAKQASEVTQQSLKAYLAKGPTALQLKAAKQFLMDSFPVSLSSNRALLQNLIQIGYFNLPLDYLNHYTTQINHVTVTDIRTAFAKHVIFAQLTQVTVGGKP